MSSPRVRRRGIERLYSAEDEVLDKVVQEVCTYSLSKVCLSYKDL